MTPYTYPGEHHHTPGNTGLGLMKDIGWDGSIYYSFINIDKTKVEIFPNPCESMVSIISEDSGRYQFEVYNIYGQKVKSEKAISGITKIDMSNLDSGVYIFNLTSGNETSISTRVIKR
jgi:hypothetical protein